MTKTHASKRKVDPAGLPHQKGHLHDLRPKNRKLLATLWGTMPIIPLSGLRNWKQLQIPLGLS